MENHNKIRSMIHNIRYQGIFLLIIGLFMLLWPNTSLKILCIVIGVILILFGLADLIQYVRKTEPTSTTLTKGIIQLVIGILLIVISNFFVSILLILAGIALLYGCYRMFRKAYELRNIRGKDFYVSLIPAILILILAIVMIFNPVGTAAFIVQLVGAAVIIEGLFMVFTAKTT